MLSKRNKLIVSAISIILVSMLLAFFINPFRVEHKITVNASHRTISLSGNFSQIGSTNSTGILTSNGSATSSIIESGYNASYLTMLVSQYGNFVAGPNYFQVVTYLWIHGSLAPNLHPKKIVLNLNDVGSSGSYLGIKAAFVGDLVNGTGSNTTYLTPYLSQGTWFIGTSSANSTIGLTNQTTDSSSTFCQFQITVEYDLYFPQDTSGFSGNHEFNLSATLGGLAQPVPIYFNVYLNNTT